MAEEKAYINLQPTEQHIANVAGNILSAYIISGKVTEGDEAQWKEKAVELAIQIARDVDDRVVAPGEMS